MSTSTWNCSACSGTRTTGPDRVMEAFNVHVDASPRCLERGATPLVQSVKKSGTPRTRTVKGAPG